LSAVSEKLMPPSIEVLTSSSAPAWSVVLMALKSALPSLNVIVPKQFRNQQTRIAERCVFRDLLQLAALRFQSETYRDAKPAPDGRSSTN